MATTFAAIDPNIKWYLTLAALVAAIAIGLPMAVRVWREAKGEDLEVPDTPADLFAPLAEAYASGQMSEEEYRRIRDSLVPRTAPAPRTTKRPQVDPTKKADEPPPTNES